MKELLPLSGWYKRVENYILLHSYDVCVVNEHVIR